MDRRNMEADTISRNARTITPFRAPSLDLSALELLVVFLKTELKIHTPFSVVLFQRH